MQGGSQEGDDDGMADFFNSVRDGSIIKDSFVMKKKSNHKHKHETEDEKKDREYNDWVDEQIHVYSAGANVAFLDLKRSTALNLLVFQYFFMIAAFIYFVYTGTVSTLKTQYISLERNTADQICDDVPIAITGQWEANLDGKWSSDPTFNYNTSALLLTASDAHIDETKFRKSISKLQSRFKTIGLREKNRDLSWSYLAWSTLVAKDESANLTMKTTANPSYIFANKVVTLSISDEDQLKCSSFDSFGHQSAKCTTNCHLNLPSATIGANGGNSQIRLTFPMKYYANSLDITSAWFVNETTPFYVKYSPSFSPCPGLFVLGLTFGFSKQTPPPTFESDFQDLKMEADVESMMIAISVNYGIKTLGDLQEVQSVMSRGQKESVWNSWPETSSINVRFYIDPSLSTARPIACILEGTKILNVTVAKDFCMYYAYSNFMYPSMWSSYTQSTSSMDVGNNIGQTRFCKCDDDDDFNYPPSEYASPASKRSGCNNLLSVNIDINLIYSKATIYSGMKINSVLEPEQDISNMLKTLSPMLLGMYEQPYLNFCLLALTSYILCHLVC